MTPLETMRPSLAALRERIAEEAVRVTTGAYAARLRAVVLTGSLARDEGTFLWEGERGRVLGDAEFYLVFREREPVPPEAAVLPLARRIELELERDRLSCRVGLSPVSPDYLRRLPRHISPFELKTCGRVIWGDAQVLAIIPEFSAADIDREDAWRLLGNRMIEQLEAWRELTLASQNRVPYGVIKLYLDMATSYLVFAGAFEATYSRRDERLGLLAEHPVGDPPFPLASFAERVHAATEFKVHGEPATAGLLIFGGLETFWKDAVRYAQRLWRWELQQLTGFRQDVKNHELMRRWMAEQHLRRKLRGWAYVLRACGWHRSFRHWPHWIKLARRASPRYGVYAAAGELLFQLPELVDAGSGGASRDACGEPRLDCEEMRGWLPVARESDEELDWQRLAADIAWNYHRFLEFTRS